MTSARRLTPFTDSRNLRATDRVFRPHVQLPAPGVAVTPAKQREHAVASPDILAGLLRQFCTSMLDIGRFGILDEERYQIYRRMTFDVRDELQGQLDRWLKILGYVGPDGEVRPEVLAAMLERDD